MCMQKHWKHMSVTKLANSLSTCRMQGTYTATDHGVSLPTSHDIVILNHSSI